MTEPVSLFELIKKGGYEASLFTTFNATLPFYEDVILRKLVSAGCRHNVVLMDARQFAGVWENPSSRPQLAGHAYTLLPVHATGAFHPKLCLLVGPKRATVLVGSHNLTLSGFGFNHEITNWFEVKGAGDAEGTAVLAEAWQLTQEWIAIEQERVPAPVLKLVHAIDKFIQPLLVNASLTAIPRILAQGPNRASLIKQLAERVTGAVTRISVLGAFFDSKLTFLQELQKRWPAAEIVVGMDPETVQHPGKSKLGKVHYVDARGLWQADRCYLHAKALMVHCKNSAHDVFLSGSANPSYPAWMGYDGAGNIEAMVWHWGADAAKAAKRIGLDRLPKLPKVEASAFAAMAERHAQAAPEENDALPVLTGYSDMEHNLIRIQLPKQFRSVKSVRLHGADIEELIEVAGFHQADGWLDINADGDLLVIRTCILAAGSQDIARAMVTHPTQLEAFTRSGRHHDMRKQLALLGSEQGDISNVISYVERIIFSDDSEKSVTFAVRELARRNSNKTESEAPTTLEVSLKDISNRHSKAKLANSGDIGDLIDVLSHRMDELLDRQAVELDKRGRTEEELVSSDDASEDEEDLKTSSTTDIAVAQAVSRKVGALCRKMTSQLEQAQNDGARAAGALVRLLAVLALFRELRHLDKTKRWRSTGIALVSEETRRRLLMRSLVCLLKSESILLSSIDLAVGEQTEDSKQLKSLLAWLAWDLGEELSMDAAEILDAEERNGRLKANAMFIRLMPAIAADPVAGDLLRASVLRTASETPEAQLRAQWWLKRHLDYGLAWSHGSIESTQLKLGGFCRIPNLVDEPAVIVELDSEFVGFWDFDEVRRFSRNKVIPVVPAKPTASRLNAVQPK